jgi:hypothetical protein
VGFRGSKEARDYLNDSKYWFKSLWRGSEVIRVHRGFHGAVVGTDKNEQSAMDQIAARVHGVSRIYFTGHSLGGAKAMITALKLREAGFLVAGVHVFGCPRAGNGYWRNAYNAFLGSITYRWEAQGDPVPWLPPLLHNFRHAGRAAYLKNDGRVIVEPALWDHVPAFAQQLGKAPASFVNRFINLFDPHFIANYERLFKQLKEVA